jgi:hypothetical protein
MKSLHKVTGPGLEYLTSLEILRKVDGELPTPYEVLQEDLVACVFTNKIVMYDCAVNPANVYLIGPANYQSAESIRQMNTHYIVVRGLDSHDSLQQVTSPLGSAEMIPKNKSEVTPESSLFDSISIQPETSMLGLPTDSLALSIGDVTNTENTIRELVGNPIKKQLKYQPGITKISLNEILSNPKEQSNLYTIFGETGSSMLPWIVNQKGVSQVALKMPTYNELAPFAGALIAKPVILSYCGSDTKTFLISMGSTTQEKAGLYVMR